MDTLENHSTKAVAWYSRFLETINRLPPRNIIWAAWWLIIAELLILLIVDPVFYRDSGEYIALTEAFRLSAWERAFPPHLPVLYTCFSGILTKIGIPSVSALLLVSGLFTAATVFPLYGWLRVLLSPVQAAWGVFLYALYPEIIRCGCAPLLDSGRFFFIFFALWLIFSDWQQRRPLLRISLLGLAYAGMTLVRAEGICFVAILMAIHGLLLIHHHRAEGKMILFRKLSACMVLPLLIVVVLSLPRLVQMQQLCGYPGIDMRQSRGINDFLRLFSSPEPVASTTPSAPESVQEEIKPVSSLKILLDQPRYYRNLISGINPWYLPFTLIGLFLLWRDKRFHFNHGMVLLLLFFYCGFHFLVRASAGRYLLMAGLLLIPFTMEGITWLFNLVRCEYAKIFPVAVAVLFMIAAIQIVRSLDNLRDRKTREYRTIKVLFQAGGPLQEASRSHLRHPVVLLVGPDRGLGIYAGVNVITYQDYPFNLPARLSIAEALNEGISSADVFSWQTREIPPRVDVDVIISYKNQWTPPGGTEADFKEYTFPDQNKLRVWKVLLSKKDKELPHVAE